MADASEVARNGADEPGKNKAMNRVRKLARSSPDAKSSPDTTDGAAASHLSSDKPKYFSPEWWAQVREEDEKLKKSMSICRGC
jgi:hypothetical protein